MAHYKPHSQAVFTQLDDGAGVLLHLESKLYYSLNGSGVFLWKLVDDHQSDNENDLIARLKDHFQISDETARQDVKEFLEDLLRENLLLAQP